MIIWSDLLKPGIAAVICIAAFNQDELISYPVDGYEHTRIGRLLQVNPANLPGGARLHMDHVTPSGNGESELPPPDEELTQAIVGVLGDEADNYSVTLLDITNPGQPVLAQHNPGMVANIGSVGKLIVLMALFRQLAILYPEDMEARDSVLRDSIVIADDWTVSDHHVVPILADDGNRIERRKLIPGDRGSLWEFLDWMLSASSNAAASMVIQQVILLEHFGRAYRGSSNEAINFLRDSTPAQLGRLWHTAMERPLAEAGFDLQRFRQGSPFTHTSKKHVASTMSVGNTTDLVRVLSLIESGQFIDTWSSLEAKRLLYMTQRRIRYASHPVLNDAAVYFKSGSLYSCQPEPGFSCRQYMGNKVNRLASIAIIESPATDPRFRYLVAVMSNVLRINSAVAHQTLALRIHRLIESRHGSDIIPADSGIEPGSDAEGHEAGE